MNGRTLGHGADSSSQCDDSSATDATTQLGATGAAIEAIARSAEGSVPLTDTAAGVGLYAGGNDMPASHRSAAPLLEPIDGVVGLAAIGMSNGLQEWDAFTALVENRGNRAGAIALANGAVRFRTMSDWIEPRNGTWERAIEGIAASGMGPQHIQVVWMKMGSKLHELGLTPTQQRVDMERRWLGMILAEAVEHLPNLRRVYISSRIYAGYARSTNHLEPATGFDNGLAVRAVVADAVAGRTPVWAAWGPYLWADGSRPREDGFVWLREDFEDDGVHPSEEGARKVGSLLLDFFSTEPAMAWLFTNDGLPS